MIKTSKFMEDLETSPSVRNDLLSKEVRNAIIQLSEEEIDKTPGNHDIFELLGKGPSTATLPFTTVMSVATTRPHTLSVWPISSINHFT